MTAVGRIELADCPMPAAGADEVVVRMEYCGICGSDAHFYKEGRIGKKVAPLPFILGHEVSGYVTECGADVTALQPGDRVALEPGRTLWQVRALPDRKIQPLSGCAFPRGAAV